MKHKFKEFLENLDYNEVLELQKQLKAGDSNIKTILNNHVNVIERMNARVCATCGNELNISSKNLVLHFGPENFKKKASFCAFDCLEFFLEQLKNIEKKKERENKL